MGCIVTEEIDFPDEPDCPPSIVSRPTAVAPIGIVDLDSLDEGRDGGVSSEELLFEVNVRDCNVDEVLEYELYADFRVVGGEITGKRLSGDTPITIEPTGSSVRPLDIRVDRSELDFSGMNVCHRIELFVSGNFASIRVPQESGDLDVATWYVTQGDMVDPTSCTP